METHKSTIRVMVAEDEELTRLMVRTQLEQMGYEIVGEAERAKTPCASRSKRSPMSSSWTSACR
jgi:AmiR/NasT family two-component response regulator